MKTKKKMTKRITPIPSTDLRIKIAIIYTFGILSALVIGAIVISGVTVKVNHKTEVNVENADVKVELCVKDPTKIYETIFKPET